MRPAWEAQGPARAVAVHRGVGGESVHDRRDSASRRPSHAGPRNGAKLNCEGVKPGTVTMNRGERLSKMTVLDLVSFSDH